ncbi:MAG TPA: MerR family transcriptional regulator [Solirubrobacteraceae bacterium]|nr:MerR family transcriptional regulator [Solirubrobacteraceae bacterium]
MAIEDPAEQDVPPGAPAEPDRNRGGKALTIGAVCKALAQEFPDISISKIRYLEDQKLLQPRRTAGGYRLYSSADVTRLRTILRLQRDEFLPLRVIRQELARGRSEEEAAPAPERRSAAVPRRAGVSVREQGALTTLEEMLETTGASPALVKELEDFGLIGAQTRPGGSARLYDDTDREIVRACAELARFGVGGRNLRVFKTSADRESQLLQQILAPSLRSRNPDRRREAVDALENLAAVASHLKHLLLVRDLRRIVRST